MSQIAEFPESLVLVGAGKMGGSLLEGWLQQGFPGNKIAVIDPHPAQAIQDLCARAGIALNPASLPFRPATLVLAIKPQMLEASAAAIDALIGPDTVVVSILAGKTIANLRHYLTKARAVVRTMPNLPAAIGQGATGAIANGETSPSQRRAVDALLKTSGVVEWLTTETQIDAVTAISGSGPAYVFYMAECLTEAGVALGLPVELAARLASATVSGSASLMAESALSPSTLRENVTSPGGTTAAALQVLMAEDGLKKLMERATAAANKRAAELAG